MVNFECVIDMEVFILYGYCMVVTCRWFSFICVYICLQINPHSILYSFVHTLCIHVLGILKTILNYN